MNSEVTYGQEFPAYLRSNYVSKPLIETRGDDFGLSPMTKGYFVFCSNGRRGLGRILREPKIDLFLSLILMCGEDARFWVLHR